MNERPPPMLPHRPRFLNNRACACLLSVQAFSSQWLLLCQSVVKKTRLDQRPNQHVQHLPLLQGGANHLLPNRLKAPSRLLQFACAVATIPNRVSTHRAMNGQTTLSLDLLKCQLDLCANRATTKGAIQHKLWKKGYLWKRDGACKYKGVWEMT